MKSRLSKISTQLKDVPLSVFAAGCLVLGLLLVIVFAAGSQRAPASSQVSAPVATSSSVVVAPSPCDASAAITSGVDVSLRSDLTASLPGTQVGVYATLKNTNPYPAYDGKLYIRVFKDASTSSPAYLVDEFSVPHTVDVLGGQTASTTFIWRVPVDAQKAKYHLQSYFVFPHRPFMPPATLSVAQSFAGGLAFGIESRVPSDTVVRTDDLKVNGVQQSFETVQRGLSFDPKKETKIELFAQNGTKIPYEGTVEWRLYTGSYSPLSAPIAFHSDVIKVHPHTGVTFSYVVPAGTQTAYYLEARIIKNGTPQTLIGIPLIAVGLCGLSIFGAGSWAVFLEIIALLAIFFVAVGVASYIIRREYHK